MVKPVGFWRRSCFRGLLVIHAVNLEGAASEISFSVVESTLFSNIHILIWLLVRNPSQLSQISLIMVPFFNFWGVNFVESSFWLYLWHIQQMLFSSTSFIPKYCCHLCSNVLQRAALHKHSHGSWLVFSWILLSFLSFWDHSKFVILKSWAVLQLFSLLEQVWCPNV